jgi:hypothetical protein
MLQLLLAPLSCLFCIVSWVIDRMNTCCCILNTHTHTQTTCSSLVVKDTSSEGWRRHASDKELVLYKVFRPHWIRLRAVYPYYSSFRRFVCGSAIPSVEGATKFGTEGHISVPVDEIVSRSLDHTACNSVHIWIRAFVWVSAVCSCVDPSFFHSSNLYDSSSDIFHRHFRSL